MNNHRTLSLERFQRGKLWWLHFEQSSHMRTCCWSAWLCVERDVSFIFVEIWPQRGCVLKKRKQRSAGSFLWVVKERVWVWIVWPSGKRVCSQAFWRQGAFVGRRHWLVCGRLWSPAFLKACTGRFLAVCFLNMEVGGANHSRPAERGIAPVAEHAFLPP